MSVRFTNEVEKERIQTRVLPKTSWGYYSGDSLVEAVRTARDMGWKQKTVQVRFEKDHNNLLTYYVEPYEKGCGCKGLLKYSDFFD